MSGMFKAEKPEVLTPPSAEDERQRKLAQQAKEYKGGASSTILTRGLATPLPSSPASLAGGTLLTGA